MSLLLAILAQVGPFQTPVPPILRPPVSNPRKPGTGGVAPVLPKPATTVEGRLTECLAMAESDAAAAAELAENWLEAAKGAELASANHCLGVASARLQNWSDAESALLAARNATPEGDTLLRARLGGLAGFAALEGNHPERALGMLDPAVGDADLAGEKQLAGEIELDRARALVSLRRMDEASAALGRARGAAPVNAEVWLLSAALARRMGQLRQAQSHVEEAARLNPVDPAIGVEAGLIAVLSGCTESARNSWQSVIDVAPQSEEATTARGYLEQL